MTTLEELPAAREERFVRQPAQVLYGGAHLFSRETFAKVQRIAVQTLEAYQPEPLGEMCGFLVSDAVYARLERKLRTAPLDDYRIDFEDGYGLRTFAEEDAHAEQAARALGEAVGAPPQYGLRIKALTQPTAERALRTLDLFLKHLPPVTARAFVVTLPKVEAAVQVRALCEALAECERRYQLPRLKVELMLEGPAALDLLGELLAAGDGRVSSVHFGAHDFLSALSVVAGAQSLAHPLCAAARAQAMFRLAGRAQFADGATTLLPLSKEPHSMAPAFLLHATNVRRALSDGIYQGWDLHPAQLVPRYAALFSFFAAALPEARRRWDTFLDGAARATASGGVFDDAATGQGLVNFFLRGIACGALDEDQAGIDPAVLATRSFSEILRRRVTASAAS